MKLWKDNKQANKYEMDRDEIVRQFWQSDIADDWREYGGNTDYMTALFVGKNLASTIDPDDLKVLQQAVWDARNRRPGT